VGWYNHEQKHSRLKFLTPLQQGLSPRPIDATMAAVNQLMVANLAMRRFPRTLL